jgi:hypothetical protein
MLFDPVNISWTIPSFVIAAVLAIAASQSTKMGLLGSIQSTYSRFAFGVEKKVHKQQFYDLADKLLLSGTPVSMKQYQGDVLCIVNVASH